MAIDFNTAQGKQLIGGAIYCSVRSLIKDKNKWITIDDFINSFQENKVLISSSKPVRTVEVALPVCSKKSCSW